MYDHLDDTGELEDDAWHDYHVHCWEVARAWDMALERGIDFFDALDEVRNRRRGIVMGAYTRMLAPGLAKAFRDNI